jgi:hypothetical protein
VPSPAVFAVHTAIFPTNHPTTEALVIRTSPQEDGRVARRFADYRTWRHRTGET